jgi:hypothetical protein
VRSLWLIPLIAGFACADSEAFDPRNLSATDAGVDNLFTPTPHQHLDGGLSYPTDPLAFAARGQWDAGFTLTPTAPPVEGDPCGPACFGSVCAPHCRLQCRQVLKTTPQELQADVLDCVTNTPCDVFSCRREQAIVQEHCTELCDSPCTPFGNNELCPQRCSAALTLMTPVARQGYLDCALNDCPANPGVRCHPADFFGPAPTAACLSFAREQQRCDENRRTNVWQEVWACESWRSPSDQNNRLAGNHLVECLGASERCGYSGFFSCISEAVRATERADVIGQLCAQAQGCEDAELFPRCRFLLGGMTTLIGESRLVDAADCLTEAGTACPSIDACLASLTDPRVNRPDCVAGCLRCGELDDSCVRNCSLLGGSLSLVQNERFSACLETATCDNSLARRCAAESLAAISDACDAFENLLQNCAEVPQRPLPAAHALCSISGLRTGLLNRSELTACVERLGCVADPLAACLRGTP